MRKTVCKVHQIAHQEDTTCSYCEGMKEDLSAKLQVDTKEDSLELLLDFLDDDFNDPNMEVDTKPYPISYDFLTNPWRP
jgi:hypothetical protein